MNKSRDMIKKVIIVLLVLVAVGFILIKAENLIKEKTDGKVNLIINNNNVTARLKNEVKIDNGIIYVSMDDMKNFFDKYIYIEEETNEIITTYDDKIASIGFEANKLTLNGSTKKISAHALKDNDIVYMPISEMLDVYNIELKNIEETKVITIESLEREQITANTKTKMSVKSKNRSFSKTVDKVQKGENIIIIDNGQESGWAKIRTQRGKIGYIKSNKITDITTTR